MQVLGGELIMNDRGDVDLSGEYFRMIGNYEVKPNGSGQLFKGVLKTAYQKTV